MVKDRQGGIVEKMVMQSKSTAGPTKAAGRGPRGTLFGARHLHMLAAAGQRHEPSADLVE